MFLEEIELLTDRFEEKKSNTQRIWAIHPTSRGPDERTVTTANDDHSRNPGNLIQVSETDPPAITKPMPDRTRTEQVRKLLRLNHLNREETEHVEDLLRKNSDLFQLPGDSLGYTTATIHEIPTTDGNPVHTKQYRFPHAHKKEIDVQVGKLIKNDVVPVSTSPYSSPLWIVPKKPDSQENKRWRMVIDYRALNEKTIGDAYPLPNINEILD